MSGFMAVDMGSLAGLAGALAFAVAGTILVVRSLRVRGEKLADRIELVQPRAAAARASLPRESETRIYRVPAGRLTPETREAVRRLAARGMAAETAWTVYRVGRLAGAGCIGILTFLAAQIFVPAAHGTRLSLLAAAVGMVVAWMVPASVLKRAIKRRTAIVAGGLPDAIELMVVCVEAGLSLEDGIARTVIEMRHSQPALADELALTAADLKILPSRDQALANLAERVDVPSVRAFVTTLSQTLRYGTPLAHALRTVAAELRDDALLRIEERANQLPVLLTIPLMIFIMPTIFLVVGGPAALRIFDIFLR